MAACMVQRVVSNPTARHMLANPWSFRWQSCAGPLCGVDHCAKKTWSTHTEFECWSTPREYLARRLSTNCRNQRSMKNAHRLANMQITRVAKRREMALYLRNVSSCHHFRHCHASMLRIPVRSLQCVLTQRARYQYARQANECRDTCGHYTRKCVRMTAPPLG